MHARKSLRRQALPLVAATALLMTGCRTAPEVALGAPATLNGVTVTVTSAELQYLDLEGLQGGSQTEVPYLVIDLSLTNGSEGALRYDLNWGASAATQAQAPLLFVAPPAEAELTSGSPIAPVAFLGDIQYLADPVSEATNVAVGEGLADLLFFEAPPAGATELVLSLNPGMFGGDNPLPAYVRIPAPAGDPAPPAATPMGTAHVGPDFTFTMQSAALEWVRLTNSTDGRDGFSERPLLKLTFEVTNTGESELVYAPPGVSNTEYPPTLSSGQTPVARAAFAPTITVEGAQTSRASIPAGGSYTGFLLFEAPAPDVTQLRFTIPGKRFGSTGLIRVDIPHTHTEVPEPEELTPQEIQAPAPE